MARGEQPDFLEQMTREREARSPGFGAKVDDAYHRRLMSRALAARRQALGLSQSEVAQRMQTSQAAVSRLEAGGDVRVSTLTRYLEAVGIPADWPTYVIAAT